MSEAGTIKNVVPRFALPGSEVSVEAEGFEAVWGAHACFFGSEPATIIAASSRRILAAVPESSAGNVTIALESGQTRSNSVSLTVGKMLDADLHNVASPAIDPMDGAVVVTRSGSRGYQLPNTLIRLEKDAFRDELPVEILNPTGIAFSPEGDMFVSNRSAGEVYMVVRGEEKVTYATGLGVATGIAFDAAGVLYVGDRTGTIYRVPDAGVKETFASLEPSVAAYHLAFGPDGRLYVTSPGLSSHDAIRAIDRSGEVSVFARGFGRPQGLAFSKDGDLFAVACYQGKHGVVRISPDGKVEHWVAANNAVGICFSRDGEMIVSTSEAVYSIPMGIQGTLLT